MKVRTGLLFASSAALLTMTGCVDQNKDYYDAEATAAIYAEAFPITNIDPNQDWKTTSNVSLNVAVEEDEGVKYTVRVYTADPIYDSSNAKLLAEGVARKGQPYSTTIDVPNELEGVYITRTDEHNRTIEHYAEVSNNAVTTTFGFVATRSDNELSKSLAKTRSEEVTIPTRTPYTSEADVRAKISSAVEYTDGLNLLNSGMNIAYVPKGKSVTCTQTWLSGPATGTYLIVEGTLTLAQDYLSVGGGGGVEICILDGGELISSNLQLGGSASLAVYKGGKITNTGKLDIGSCGTYTWTGHNIFYIDGTVTTGTLIGGKTDAYIDANGSLTTSSIELNGGSDYVVNLGKASLGDVSKKIEMVYNKTTITGTQFESSLTNYGTATFESCYKNYNQDVTNYGTFTVKGTFHGDLINNGQAWIKNTIMTDNNTLVNNCYFYCEGDFRGDITTASNTRTDIGGDLYAGYKRNMAANSMIVVEGKASLQSATFTGPSGSDYALFRAGEITDFQLNSGDETTPCHVYFETDNLSDTSTGDYGNVTWTKKWLSKVGGAFGKVGEATFTLAKGDCTGDGNTPSTTGQTPLPTTPQSYTYAFEDCYPYAGDYDFNDLVLDVTPVENTDDNGNTTGYDIAVKLKAVGGTRKIGLGLRLYGIESSAIGTVTYSGDTSIRNTLSGSQLGNEDKESGAGNYTVLPLFGDAHKALGVSEYIRINTLKGGTTASAKTLTIHIATSQKISLDNLDFFLVNGLYGSNSKRTEVHLFQFIKGDDGKVKSDAATEKGTVCENAGVVVEFGYTWAIMAPTFKYPVEFMMITDAYPNFLLWGSDHSKNIDWYNSPTDKTDRVYFYED